MLAIARESTLTLMSAVVVVVGADLGLRLGQADQERAAGSAAAQPGE